MWYLQLPDRTKVFLAAFWLWTWFLLQFNKICSIVLESVLVWIPEKFTPVVQNKTPVRILKALDNKGNIITKKLNLFLNTHWDKELCDDKGGVDFDIFSKYVGCSIIWVAYLLEYELNEEYNDFISATRDNNFTSKDFSKLLKAIMIDITNKVSHKLGQEESEHILFGEVDLH